MAGPGAFILISAVHPFLAFRDVRADNDEINPVDHLYAAIVLDQPDFTSSVEATTPSGMKLPHAVTVDPTTGKVFVAEPYNHRVLRFASASELSNGAMAEVVLGQADFYSGQANRGGPTANKILNRPLGVSVDM